MCRRALLERPDDIAADLLLGVLRRFAHGRARRGIQHGRGACPDHSLGRDAVLSIPTPDHYLPLLYVLGTRQKGESASFPVEGVDGGSVQVVGTHPR